MSGHGLSLLQSYDSASETESQDSEDEEDNIVVTINKKVLMDTNPLNVNALKRTLSVPKGKSIVGEKRFKENKKTRLEKPAESAKDSVIDTQLDFQPHRSDSSEIPLPTEINRMFLGQQQADQRVDDPSLHGGRVRSFGHEKNNWATYVYIDLQDCDLEPAKDLLTSELDLENVESNHLSISRVVSLKHHWVEPFVESLKKALVYESSFHLSLDRLKVYVNDDRTRTFVGLEASSGIKQLHRLTEKVDKCMKEFSLPPFYKPASFHCSLAWGLLDQQSILRPQLQKLQLKMVDVLDEDEVFGDHIVKQITIKSGNKIYQIKLR